MSHKMKMSQGGVIGDFHEVDTYSWGLQKCGCRVLPLSGPDIKYCSMHKAARSLWKVCKAILDSEQDSLGDGGSILGNDYRIMLEKAISKAEGRDEG